MSLRLPPFLLGVLLIVQACMRPEAPEAPAPPNYYMPWTAMPELFHYVQTGRVFPDGKTFVDYRPKIEPALIEEQFDSISGEGKIDIKAFINTYFEPPVAYKLPAKVDTSASLQSHLEAEWEQLIREPVDPAGEEGLFSTLIPLPERYVVPGGRFREIYYWDSYFTMQGLAVTGREDLIISMLDNFVYLIDDIGYIPNGNRTYFLGRSQPPYFAGMIELLSRSNPQAAAGYLPQLAKEYAFWMEGADLLSPEAAEHRRVVMLEEGIVLNRYFDDGSGPRPESYREDIALASDLERKEEREALYQNLRAACESGWDFSTRWFADPADFSSIKTTRIIPVDLNCLLYRMEYMLGILYEERGEEGLAARFATLAEKRKAAILRYCWDAGRGIFADYDLDAKASTGILSTAGLLPLYLRIATKEQAASMRAQVMAQLRQSGGLATTTIASGQQWDSPNGWAPQQWIGVQALANYGYAEEAKALAHDWLRLNEKVFRESGKMMEKYNVVDLNLAEGGGEYPTQDGFGWTNGVALALIATYGMPEAEPTQ